MKMSENIFAGSLNRLLQLMARFGPGATSLRVWLHRMRGVRIGKNVWIGYDVVIETSRPQLVEICDGAVIGMRATIIAHFRELDGVVIGEDVFLGPGVIVMPSVNIGRGAVATAGSVVTASIEPMTMVQGNPAKPVARIGKVLDMNISMKKFIQHLRPMS